MQEGTHYVDPRGRAAKRATQTRKSWLYRQQDLLEYHIRSEAATNATLKTCTLSYVVEKPRATERNCRGPET
jgi:hypothetical protein